MTLQKHEQSQLEVRRMLLADVESNVRMVSRLGAIWVAWASVLYWLFFG